MSSISRRSIAASAIAFLAVVGVTACSSGGSDTTDTAKPKHSASATAQAAETTYNECIDGAVQLFPGADADPAKTVEAEDCAAANVIGSDLTYALGHTKVVTVEAQNTTVSVQDPERITFTGNDNTLTYTGEAPQVDDQGTGNTVRPAA